MLIQNAPVYIVTLERFRATWHYFTTNPAGGGFGSNRAGAGWLALAQALRDIPEGAKIRLTINHRYRVIFARNRTDQELKALMRDQPRRSPRP